MKCWNLWGPWCSMKYLDKAVKVLQSAAAGSVLAAAILLAGATGGLPAAGQEAEEPFIEEAKSPRLSRLQGSAYLGRNRFVVGATVLIRPQDESSRIFVTSSDSRNRAAISWSFHSSNIA